jgi:hypothetical protein
MGVELIFGPKRKEVTRGWRWLHNDELYNLSLLQIVLGWSYQGGCGSL